MSTTTNFKRIALVAVAALGMGVLSSVPSQAAFQGTAGSQLTITTTNGTGSLEGSASDSTTAGTVTVKGLGLAASDSYSITAIKKSWPALTTAALTPGLNFQFIDTATSTGAVLVSSTANSDGLNTTTDSATTVAAAAPASANVYVNSNWYAFQDSSTASDRIAGTYVYTIIVTPMGGGTAAGTAQIAELSITIAALSTASTTASAATSTAFIGTATAASSDAVLSAVATASDTPVGYLTVLLKNSASGTAARESVTITTTIGTVGDGTVRGRSVVVKYSPAGDAGVDYKIYPDGTAGTGTITVSTPSVTFSTKTVSFYAKAAKTLTATVAHPKLKVGTNSGAVRVTGVDANGIGWAGTAYIYASSAADALIAGSETPAACSWNVTFQRHDCSVTGKTAGTAKFKIIDAATVALATATSNEITVTVNTAAVAKVAISFDKATYAPNERMLVYVTPQDATGASLPAATYANLFAAGGISANAGFSGSSDTLTPVAITTSAADSSATGAKAGSAMYVVYAPAAGGKVTITATGGTSLPVSGQVAVTASATVTDSAAAALAAVSALATTVASLKTLITTLTNLVLKIQKKVKA
jgi:hypothetical protein